jgi:hypothetical protein
MTDTITIKDLHQNTASLENLGYMTDTITVKDLHQNTARLEAPRLHDGYNHS